MGQSSYADSFDDYMAFLLPRLEEAHRLLKPSGSLFVHLDYREVHYAKVALDRIFGRESFINEIVWSYDYGARATNRWSPKHDNILWYAKDPKNYCFNFDEIDRIPYMAPELVGAEKAERGKTPTDCWWHTIVSPNGKEKTGYPTQKPLGILTRIVRVHSNPGDRLLDFFAGSGSFGEAGAQWGRQTVLVDRSPEAIAVMKRRFQNFECRVHDVASEDAAIADVDPATVARHPQEDCTRTAAELAAQISPTAATESLASTREQEPPTSEAGERSLAAARTPLMVVPPVSSVDGGKAPPGGTSKPRGQQTLF